MRKIFSSVFFFAAIIFAAAIGHAQCNNVCDWDFDHCTACHYEPDGGNSACSCMSDGSCHFILCGSPLAGNKQPQCTQLQEVAFQSTQKAGPTLRLAYLPIPDSPMVLEDIASGGSKDIIRRATAHNNGSTSIKSFRIGLLVVSPDHIETREITSEEVRLSTAAGSQTSFALPATNFHAENAAKGSLVAFYVAEVKFGKKWTADVHELKSKLVRNSSRAGLSGDPLRLSNDNLTLGLR